MNKFKGDDARVYIRWGGQDDDDDAADDNNINNKCVWVEVDVKMRMSLRVYKLRNGLRLWLQMNVGGESEEENIFDEKV